MKHLFVIGVDEAGRGPLAGPVTAAAVVLDSSHPIDGLGDSKKLSEKRRAELYPRILKHAFAQSIVSVGPRRIERINIREASRLAMSLAVTRVLRALRRRIGEDAELNCVVLVDGNTPIETECQQETIIKGDAKVTVIGAASILAKVHRDALMERLADQYPQYAFEAHKGYPTKAHRELLASHGVSPVHRRTFAGVREHI